MWSPSSGSLGDVLADGYFPTPEVAFRQFVWQTTEEPDDDDVQGSGTVNLRDGSGIMTLSWSTARARMTREERGIELSGFAATFLDEVDELTLPLIAGSNLAESDPRWYLAVLDGATEDRHRIGEALTERGTWRGILDLFAAQRHSALHPQVILPLMQLRPGSAWRRWYRANPARIDAAPGRVLIALEGLPQKRLAKAWHGVEFRTLVET